MGELSEQTEIARTMGNSCSCCRSPEDPDLDNVRLSTTFMPTDLLEHVIDVAKKVNNKRSREDDSLVSIARHIKLELDENLGPVWQVIVGENYGYDGAHKKDRFAHFYIGEIEFLIAQII